ncbi:RNHCP domain-containing protein [Candidatus Peregrinibacteria bacterium]|nr:RNHCP domain-containing protein [Candidatus Peregrinibacteria bacterium]
MIHKNEAFICKNCNLPVKKHPSSCRNHCPHCLFSLHVDKEVPGDRKNPCHGLMCPISLDHSGKKGFIIIHQCEKCRAKTLNKAAPDVDVIAMIRI